MRSRFVLNIALAALLLAACGTSVAPQTVAPSSSAGAESSAPSTRTIIHALGTTEAPANPKRVIALDTGALANALALGVKPAGAVLYGATDLLGYLGDQTKGVQDVGGTDAPNFEAILSIQPDLIIGSEFQNGEMYDQLNQIAPTVLSQAEPSEEWKDYFKFVAGALGKTQEAEQLLSQYEQRVSTFKAAMGQRLDETEVSIFRSRPEGVDIYLKTSFAGTIIEEAGLPRPPAQNKTDPFSERISAELIPSLDADAVFWVQRNDKEAVGVKQFMQSPLWQQLDAVQQGRVYEVPWDVWIAGWNITGANLILDDLFKYLVEQQ